jgi:MFS family permease
MTAVVLAPDPRGLKLGPLWLAPGISRLNGAAYFYSTFTIVLLMSFINFLQPYLLTETLHVPKERQGAVTGLLNLVNEAVSFVVISVLGALSDRTGRRVVCATGIALLSLGLFIYPLAASEAQLFLFRIVFALGGAMASVSVIACLQDCPQEISRGKWNGINSVFTSIGIMFLSLVLAKLPTWFIAAGIDPVTTGRYTFWIMAGFGAVSAVIVAGTYHTATFIAAGSRPSLLEQVRQGFAAAARNPRIALAFGSSVASRGDLIVVGAFLSLWFARAGVQQGIDTANAFVSAGLALAALQGAILVWAPLFGLMVDRVNRVLAMGVAFGLAALGYGAVGVIENPFDVTVMIPCIMLLGAGEISAIIAGQALLGQESPPDKRGAIAGVFSMCGTLGILTATFGGGLVFDRIGFGSPFALMGVVNGLVAAWAVLVLLRAPSRGAAGGGSMHGR